MAKTLQNLGKQCILLLLDPLKFSIWINVRRRNEQQLSGTCLQNAYVLRKTQQNTRCHLLLNNYY